MKLTYVGPHDAVDVEDPPGVPRGTCARGATITVPAELGAGLLEQGPDHWRKPEPDKKPKEA